MELTQNSAKINGTVPGRQVFVDGYGVGDVGSVVLRDRKHLAEDGMIVVVVSMSGQDGAWSLVRTSSPAALSMSRSPRA